MSIWLESCFKFDSKGKIVCNFNHNFFFPKNTFQTLEFSKILFLDLFQSVQLSIWIMAYQINSSRYSLPDTFEESKVEESGTRVITNNFLQQQIELFAVSIICQRVVRYLKSVVEGKMFVHSCQAHNIFKSFTELVSYMRKQICNSVICLTLCFMYHFLLVVNEKC